MKIYDHIDKNPSRAEQIKAGAVILIGFGILGALQYFLRQRVMVGEIMWGIGGAAFLISLVPGLGRLLYIGWMGLGVTIGIFTQPVVIGLAYVILFVPIGFIFRLMGRDSMRRRLSAEKSTSYWQECEPPAAADTYFKQY